MYSYYIPSILRVFSASLLLSFVGSVSSSMAQEKKETQKRDSLHREVTIVSSKVVQVSDANPIEQSYQWEQPKVSRLKPIDPKPTGDFTPQPDVPRRPSLSAVAALIPPYQHSTSVRLSGSFFPSNYSLRLTSSGIYDWDDMGSVHFNFDYDLYAYGFNLPALYHKGIATKSSRGREKNLTLSAVYKKPFEQDGYAYTYIGIDHKGYALPGFLKTDEPKLSVDPLSVGITSASLGGGVHRFSLGEWILSTGLGYQFFRTQAPRQFSIDESKRYRANQHSIGMNGTLQKELTEDWTVGATGKYYHLYNPGMEQREQAGRGIAARRHTGFLELMPHFVWTSEWEQATARVKAGVGIGFSMAPFGSLLLFPSIDANFDLPYKTGLYIKGTGGFERVDPLVTQSQMFLVHPMLAPFPARTHTDLRVGLKASILDMFSVDLYVGEKFQSNRAFFVVDTLQRTYSPPLPGASVEQVNYYYNIGGYRSLAQTTLGGKLSAQLWSDILSCDINLERRFFAGQNNQESLPLSPEAPWYLSTVFTSHFSPRWSLSASLSMEAGWQTLGPEKAKGVRDVVNHTSLLFGSVLQYQMPQEWFTLFVSGDYRLRDSFFVSSFSPWYLGGGIQFNF